jgi:hypothetical protein
MDADAGCVVMVGGVLTVTVAAVLFTVQPAPLVTTQ